LNGRRAVILANARIQETTRPLPLHTPRLSRGELRSAGMWGHCVASWIPAFAGMSASVMLPCQEGESPSDVKS